MTAKHSKIWRDPGSSEQSLPNQQLCDLSADLLDAVQQTASRETDLIPELLERFQIYWGCQGIAVFQRTEPGRWQPIARLGGRALGTLDDQVLDEIVSRNQPLLQADCPSPGWARLLVSLPNMGDENQPLVLLVSARQPCVIAREFIEPVLPLLASSLAAANFTSRLTRRSHCLELFAGHLRSILTCSDLVSVLERFYRAFQNPDRRCMPTLLWQSRSTQPFEKLDFIRSQVTPVDSAQQNAIKQLLTDHDSNPATHHRVFSIDFRDCDHHTMLSQLQTLDSQLTPDAPVGVVRFRIKQRLVLMLIPGGWPTIRLSEIAPDEPNLREWIESLIDACATRCVELLAAKPNERIRIAGTEPGVPPELLFPEELRNQARELARTNLPITISGEPGCGQVWFAELIEQNSERTHQKMSRVFASELSAQLLEQRLGVPGNQPLTLEQWSQRETQACETLLVIGVEKLPIDAQAVLMNSLLESSRAGQSGIKFLFTSEVDLRDAVAAEQFLPDLFELIDVVSYRLRPLCQQAETVAPILLRLLNHSHNRIGFTQQAEQLLQRQTWPRNYDDLFELARRIRQAGTSGQIDEHALELWLQSLQSSLSNHEPSSPLGLTEATLEFQRQQIRTAIARNAGNMTEAARMLGLHRTNLYRKMHQLNMAEAEQGADDTD